MTCTEPISRGSPIPMPKHMESQNLQTLYQASTPALAPQPCITGVRMPSMTLKSFGEVITFHTP